MSELIQVFTDFPLVRVVALGLVMVAPSLLIRFSLSRHAKKHGRTMPARRSKIADQPAPFVDSRLNEPIRMIRRWEVLAFLAFFSLAYWFAVEFSSITLGCIFGSLAIFFASATRLFVEAGAAFGAELAAAPHESVSQVTNV